MSVTGAARVLLTLAMAGILGSGPAALADERSVWMTAPEADGPFVVAGDRDAAYLGVALAEETEHPEGGARITAVIAGSPADEAGLRDGDIVVALDGEPIRGPVRLAKRLADRRPGDRVRLAVLRDGGDLGLDVELGLHPRIVAPSGDAWAPRVAGVAPEGRVVAPSAVCGDDDDCDGPAVAPRAWGVLVEPGDPVAVVPRVRAVLGGHRPRLGVQLTAATPELREHLGAARDEGVLVSKVLSGTPAEYGGIRVGDLIVAVDGEPVGSARDLVRALAERDGETIEVDLVRDGRRVGVGVTLAERGDANAA